MADQQSFACLVFTFGKHAREVYSFSCDFQKKSMKNTEEWYEMCKPQRGMYYSLSWIILICEELRVDLKALDETL